MVDGVILTHALAGIAEVNVWKLETLSAAGDDIDERERVEASAELTKSLCRLRQAGRTGAQIWAFLGGDRSPDGRGSR